MRVLVTGHHGYIGSVLAPFLAAAGHDVVGLDTYFYAGATSAPSSSSIRGRVADVRDVTAGDLEGFDAVVHLAALSNDPLGDLQPELDVRDQPRRHGRRSRAAAKEAGVRRFVFASSCSMYGASGTDDALDENAPLRPLTPYAESKVARRGGLCASSPDHDFVARLDAERDGLRRVAAASARHRPQQPRRPGRTRRARSGS